MDSESAYSGDDYKKAYGYGIYLLAKRDYAVAELETKFKQREFPDDLTHAVIAQLQEQGYQSDERFAEVFIRTKARAGHGPQRIQHELRQKGVDSTLFSKYADSEDFDWFELALACYRKKYQGKGWKDYQDKQKRMRFLQYRGFSFDHIDYALSTNCDE